jgi:hypothetical protein
MYEYDFLVSFVIQYYLLTLFHFLSLLLYYSSRRITHFHHIFITSYCPFLHYTVLLLIFHIIAHYHHVALLLTFPSHFIIIHLPSHIIIIHHYHAVLLPIFPSCITITHFPITPCQFPIIITLHYCLLSYHIIIIYHLMP